jgi:hypothetical protein
MLGGASMRRMACPDCAPPACSNTGPRRIARPGDHDLSLKGSSSGRPIGRPHRIFLENRAAGRGRAMPSGRTYSTGREPEIRVVLRPLADAIIREISGMCELVHTCASLEIVTSMLGLLISREPRRAGPSRANSDIYGRL